MIHAQASFLNFKVYSDEENYELRDVRNDLSNTVFNNFTGVAAVDFAINIYHSELICEFNGEQYDILLEAAKLMPDWFQNNLNANLQISNGI